MREGLSLLPYYGGKAGEIGRMTAQLLEKIPHKTYCELFGGMASVLMYKDPVKQEIYNDTNGSIVNLFNVVRSKAKRKELRRLLLHTPYSRDHYRQCCAGLHETAAGDVELARRMFVVLGQAVLGRLARRSWFFGGPVYGTSPARSFYAKVERFDAVGERFRRVTLENQPAQKLIVRWDGKDVLQYWDPPYDPSTRSRGADYENELDRAGHEALLDLALGAKKARIVIAGYPNELYAQKLETVGWVRQDFEIDAESSKKNGSDNDHTRTESLWFSPNCEYKALPKHRLTMALGVQQGALAFG
jgi:DNA adenine methylase